MDFSSLKNQIIVRVGGIALTLFVLFQLSYSNSYFLTIIAVFALAVVQVILLIRYLNKNNEEIEHFFEAIKNDDFDSISNQTDDKSYNAYLHHRFEMVIKKLKKARLMRDERSQYLSTIVQHAGIGLITFNAAGNIQIFNIAARRLLGVDQVKNIEELRSISHELIESFKALKTGGRALIKLEKDGDMQQLSVYAIELILGGENYKLISLQNIQSELEENEMEAWQKLVRVLTHEIMNSVTPISSLASTVENEIMYNLQVEDDHLNITKEDMEDIHLAVQTIQRRSEGLIRFVSDFRNLTHTPQPKFQLVSICELMDQIELLLKKEFEENQIKFQRTVSPNNLSVQMDPELIQQVLINLLKNAIQALEEKQERQILINCYQDENGNTYLVVRDNGSGIDEEALSKIFIPFFTTKKKGSGIGLSLSRQIMRQHNGSISVKSKMGEGTEFTLKF
jgi:nitrogen fixation/metabolism regulation signal transduction histidine kinase